MNDAKLVNILGQRSSGILLPVFSLPGPFGIGDLGKTSRNFIDFLKQSGQSCWQILPLGPTSPVFGNSPYMSYSSFAGNPLLISPEIMLEQGLVQQADLEGVVSSEYAIDYFDVAAFKTRLLRQAWKTFRVRSGRKGMDDFISRHPWVKGHGLFLALKERFDNQPWYSWPLSLRSRQPKALERAESELADIVDAHIFEQFLFFAQWDDLRKYAHRNGVGLIGDLPIYVALDSVDVWCNQQIFQLDALSGEPTFIAGVPPDYFSATGQRWGNPLYCWNAPEPAVRDSLMDWWAQRFKINFMLVDTLRLDHFRGFESYWAVPAEEETAVNGSWQPGPGAVFFKEMQARLGEMSIIAEDLGLITPEVETLRLQLGYPGMKILLFAFDGTPDNSYLPYNCEKNSVIYTGTHDNDTAVGWYLSPEVNPEYKRRAKLFAGRQDTEASTFHRDLIYLALASPANGAILPMQDVLGFGNDCRMNIPGSSSDNWQWRCAERFFTEEIASWLKDMTSLFGRKPLQPHPREHIHEHTDL